MRYGLEDNRHWNHDSETFPVQSSVLDEEVLFREVVVDYPVRDLKSCRFLSRGDADIYRVKTTTRNFYLKVYRPPRSLAATESEGSFVWALSQAKIPVVMPVRRKDGRFAAQVPAPEGLRPMLLYQEAPPPIPSKLDEDLSSKIGGTIAMIHNAADQFEHHFGIAEFDVEGFFKQNLFFISQFLSDQDDAYLRNVSGHLKEFLQKLPQSTPEFGLCHADLVLSNIRQTEGGDIILFDFGNVVQIWRTFELAVVYWSLGNRYEDIREKSWDAFLLGFQNNRPLPEGLPENLNAMLVLRQIGFLGGNCASLPLRLGTEPFESGFIEKEIKRLRQFVERSGIMD